MLALQFKEQIRLNSLFLVFLFGINVSQGNDTLKKLGEDLFSCPVRKSLWELAETVSFFRLPEIFLWSSWYNFDHIEYAVY